MELRQLKYFEKTCELLNFTEASKALCISQSTLSQQIKQLETELGILLFDRIGKHIIITEAGKAFLPYARKAICESENGRQIICDLQNMETGQLKIGVTYSLSNLLTKALMIFSERYPKININITFATSEELMSKLEENKVDMILSFDSVNFHKSHDNIPLFSTRLYFIVSNSHRMATKSIIQFEELANVPLIIPAYGFATRGIIDKVCREENIKLNSIMEINDVQTIINMVRRGQLGTVLTFSAVRNEAELTKIPIASDYELSTHAFLLWPEGTYRKKSAIHFAEILQELTGKTE